MILKEKIYMCPTDIPEPDVDPIKPDVPEVPDPTYPEDED